LGTSFGRGGATTFQQDLQNSDCIVIQGSNMAECHPVGFQWVMEAKKHGAKVIHVDPRFTRTSAVADLHVPLRAGSDIAFLGGIVNYILSNDLYFEDYVRSYTNAATLLRDDFQDTEDLDGVFSGYDPNTVPTTARLGSTRASTRYRPRESASMSTTTTARRASKTAAGRSIGSPRGRSGTAPPRTKSAGTAPGSRTPACSATTRCSIRAAFSRYSSGTSRVTRRSASQTRAAYQSTRSWRSAAR